MDLRDRDANVRESSLQFFFKDGRHDIFRAEMAAVDDIDAELSGLEKNIVFDIGGQERIAALRQGVFQIFAA
jgi:hypothetical protein